MKTNATEMGTGERAVQMVERLKRQIMRGEERLTPKMRQEIALELAHKVIELEKELSELYAITHRMAKNN